MTYTLTTQPQPEGSVLAVLRRLVPQRQLTFDEAKKIAELQANRLRELFQITDPAFPHEAIMGMPRIEVAFDLDLPVSGSAHWNGDVWVIVLNAIESHVRQRFSMAHEFKHILDHTTKHLLYNSTARSTAAQQAEQIADYFAGCLLMPTMHLKRLFYQGVQKPSELAEYFNVSPRAVYYRLRQAGIVGNTERCTSHWAQALRPTYYQRRELAEVAA